MIRCLADTNIFVRFFVKDNPEQTLEAQKYLNQAKAGKVKIRVISEIIPEIEYVLRKVYKIKKDQIVDKLLLITEATYLDVEKRSEWSEALNLYSKNNIDLIDAFLYVSKMKYDMKILTFDRDFKKIIKS